MRSAALDSWQEAMRRGDFAAAWAVSDAILHARLRGGVTCHTWPRHEQFVWRGVPFDGHRVFVRCYHGLGDTIQFIRFAAALRRRACHVAVWVQPALLSLVATAAGVDEVMPLHDGRADVDFDVDIDVMELAHALRIDRETLPCHVPYLFPLPGDVLPVHDGRIAVGIVWRAGDWDARRSISAELMGRIGRVPGVALYSLQRGAEQRRAAAIGAIDISHEDIGVTAARLRHLDLVVSVDTMIAHLAGALGVRVWTLLPHTADWRWMHGERTPWYPSMRLWRQPRPGDWESVIDAVRDELARLATPAFPRTPAQAERTLPSGV